MFAAFKHLLLLGDAVVITDDTHTVLEVNAAFQSITGFSREEIVGKRPNMVKTQFTPQKTYDSMKEALREEKSWSGVFINQTKAKELWHSSITITPYRMDDQIYYIGLFRSLEALSEGVYLEETRIKKLQNSVLKILAISCEVRDPGIEGHLMRVRDLTERLVILHNQRCGLDLSDTYISYTAHSSILHDIGKSGIPEGLLYKPGPLLDYERMIIETHPLIGVTILEKISHDLNDELLNQEFGVAKNIILHHHERWDGGGYPKKLQGSDIPLEARIVAIVDVYDALTSKRPYKDAWPEQDAIDYILEQRGKHFDPSVTDSFVELWSSGLAVPCTLNNV